jgi:hypothetical protein
MKLEELKEKLKAQKNGTYRLIAYTRACKVKKNSPQIMKHTEGIFRVGCNYENLTSTKEGRADGTLPSESQGLNGLVWEEFPNILKNPNTNKMYLRVEVSNDPRKVTYTINGKEVSKESIKDSLYSSELKGSSTSVFNVNIDDIDKI